MSSNVNVSSNKSIQSDDQASRSLKENKCGDPERHICTRIYDFIITCDRAHKCASCNEGYHVDGNECELSGITQAEVKKMFDDNAIIMTEDELGAFFNKIDSDGDGVI